MGAFDVRDLMKADAAASATPDMFGLARSGTRVFHPLAERIAAIPVKPTLSPVMIEGLVRLLDVIAIVGAGGLIYWLYAAGTTESILPYQITIPALAIGALAAFQALHLYHVGALRNFIAMAVRLASGWTLLFLITLAVNTLMLLTGLWLLRTQDIYRAYRLWQSMEAPDTAQVRRFLALGIPAGLTIMVEVTSFTLMALFIARLGEVALASHQIAASMAAVLYMVPLSLGIATSARAGYWMGAGHPMRARRAVHTGLAIAAGMAVLCAGGLALSRHAIAGAYAKDAAVAVAAAAWLGLVAWYHLADALQAVCVFALRCWRVTFSPLLVYTALLWGVGLYGGYLLAYQGVGSWSASPSVRSFWLTSSVALAVVSVLLLARLEWAMRRPIQSSR